MEFQPPVESPQSIPSTHDSDDVLEEDNAEYSLRATHKRISIQIKIM